MTSVFKLNHEKKKKKKGKNIRGFTPQAGDNFKKEHTAEELDCRNQL